MGRVRPPQRDLPGELFFFFFQECLHSWGLQKRKNDNVLWCYPFITAPEGSIHVPRTLRWKVPSQAECGGRSPGDAAPPDAWTPGRGP